jgi:putative DNA methylase
MTQTQYLKRLIEADLPIKKIGDLVVKTEKKFPIPRGHLSTLHAWWARRPLGSCRAVILASILPDPCDELCSHTFIEEIFDLLKNFIRDVASSKELVNITLENTSTDYIKLIKIDFDINEKEKRIFIRHLLIDFIANYSSWKCGNNFRYIKLAKDLVKSSQKYINEDDVNPPIILDCFSGGGTIPLEGLRMGFHTIASELNPIAVLLNKVALYYAPKYGEKLKTELPKWTAKVHERSIKEIKHAYPDRDNEETLAYLWARTINCEGPGCGTKIPLVRSLRLAKKGNVNFALKINKDIKNKTLKFNIIENPNPNEIDKGTVKRSSASCPLCGYTTPADNVRAQFKHRRGGADDSELLAVVIRTGSNKISFREPCDSDYSGLEESKNILDNYLSKNINGHSFIPDESLPYLRSIFNINLLDVNKWVDLFHYRQKATLVIYVENIRKIISEIKTEYQDTEFVEALCTCLSLPFDKMADYNASLCQWRPTNLDVGHVFGRQALGIVWDFVEANPCTGKYVDWSRSSGHFIKVIDEISKNIETTADVIQTSATELFLPDDSVDLFITDPPYYDMVPYADLSDFFYVWQKRLIGDLHPDLFNDSLSPKKQEIVQLAERNIAYSYKTKENYEVNMKKAMANARRYLKPNGIAVVVFAHKSTETWEIQLQAMLDAGWIIVGSWPINTEMGSRLRAQNSAVLASSVHLVCRPRENLDGSIRKDKVGDWRDVLQELPERIHNWMPRLSDEGIVGADAIFACLGPALEIFSRYPHVEKTSGEKVELREYLEHIWAAVSKEALNMVFENADASGFEEDARLTAIWLWTISTASNGNGKEGKEICSTGYVLEYDAARKIAQGLGIHMEDLPHLVKTKGDESKLLAVVERTKYLFGKDEGEIKSTNKKKKVEQPDFFTKLIESESETSWGISNASKVGDTSLDRIHQSMLLFAAGRGGALQRFLVDEGVGRDPRFWSLAQALSALYPVLTDEKRWVDGVLARKKGLGL